MKNHITQFCLCLLCAWTIFSTIGCSAPIGPPRVMSVASSDGIAYAVIEKTKFSTPTDPYAQSEDGGKTWSPAKSVPQGIFQEKTQPFVLCDPNLASLCFRITQKSQVDESNDGGTTWRVGWQIPPGREDYMLTKTCQIFHCAPTSDWGPYDLSFLDQKGANTLLVAMGEQGVLVRTVEGNWQRYGVLRSTPSPLQATNWGEASNALSIESVILFLLSFIIVPIAILVARWTKSWATKWAVFAAALIFPICWLSLLLWAFGFIPRYTSALLIALIFTATVALYAAWFGTRQRPAE